MSKLDFTYAYNECDWLLWQPGKVFEEKAWVTVDREKIG